MEEQRPEECDQLAAAGDGLRVPSQILRRRGVQNHLRPEPRQNRPWRLLTLDHQLRLGYSQLAGPLLQLFLPSSQGTRELVQLRLVDLETLAAGLKLGPLGNELSLEIGPLSRKADHL